MTNYTLGDEYLARTDGTSDGTQEKYFKDNIWYKQDKVGNEGLIEELCSSLLKNSTLSQNEYVEYKQCMINNIPGCQSNTFLKPGEDFVTFYRLFKNCDGRDLTTICNKMDYDDAIEYVISFVQRETNVNVRTYLANIFTLDLLTLNRDRHFNNYGLIYGNNSFREAPIFDNGLSFLNGKYKTSLSLEENVKKTISKSFSPSFRLNYNYLKENTTLHFFQPTKDIIELAQQLPENILSYQMKKNDFLFLPDIEKLKIKSNEIIHISKDTLKTNRDIITNSSKKIHQKSSVKDNI